MTTPTCHPALPHYAKDKCKPCYDYDYYRATADAQRAYGRDRYHGQTPEDRAAQNKRHRFTRYKLTQDQYLQMHRDQGGRCAVCQSLTPPEVMVVDHDHGCCPAKVKKTCGECTRGLLCSGCNYGMGFFKDDPDLLIRAVRYLQERKL